jgi:adenylosuccinate synthase
MPKAILTVGLGFGDESKGATVDLLTDYYKSPLVVRYNGGAQAGHHTFSTSGVEHSFSQFSAGTFAGARTFLSRYMIVNPLFFLPEYRHLKEACSINPHKLVAVDRRALVTTPFHVHANRIRELLREQTGEGRHGSCGMGIGETIASSLADPELALRAGDLESPTLLREKLEAIKRAKVKSLYILFLEAIQEGHCRKNEALVRESDCLIAEGLVEQTARVMERDFLDKVELVGDDFLPETLRKETVIFEGAQGVLLDEDYGFHPHTTWSHCTFQNAEELLQGYEGVVTRMGVLRTYHTRHGEGPFPTEHTSEPDKPYNEWDWPKSFRTGYFDFVLARYARDVIGHLDEVALSCLDQVSGPQKVCIGYDACWGRLRQIRPHKEMTFPEVADNGEVVFPSRLEFQAHTGGFILGSSPVLTTLSGVDRLVSGIERTLKAPITLKSYGPTRKDRTYAPRSL